MGCLRAEPVRLDKPVIKLWTAPGNASMADLTPILAKSYGASRLVFVIS